MAAVPFERISSPSARRLDEPAWEVPGVAGWRVRHDRRRSGSLVALTSPGLVALLVMAPHGRTGWSRVVAGSVTAAVVRDAAVPVLVVPGPLDR
jgi:nucleotide-binding universal stress UspA family protein